MTMDPGDSHFLLHYLTLRRSLGILGVLLPVILIFGDLAIGEGGGLQPSLSHYYDTIMVGVFVGVLFAIGVFLFSYRGYETPAKKPYELSDNVAGKVACVAALAVALFPTTATVDWVRTVHTIAAILFVCDAGLLLYTPLYEDEARHGAPRKEDHQEPDLPGLWLGDHRLHRHDRHQLAVPRRSARRPQAGTLA